MNRRWKAVVIALVFVPAVASAQSVVEDLTEIVPDDAAPSEKATAGGGFDGTLSVAANVNLADNRRVVGQADGLSTLVGLQLIGALNYVHADHELRNALTVSESWARTPTIPHFVKNTDTVEIESLYNYFLTTWFGAFSRLAVNTTLFETQQVTAVPTAYAVTRLDGALDSVTTTELTLSDPFQPLSVYESLGVFAEPVASEPFTLTARLGAGARETLTRGALSVGDDDSTVDAVEVRELDDVYQAGAEGFIGFAGSFDDKRLTYDVGGSALLPLINNDDQERSPTDLLRLALVAKVTMSFTDWASLNYQFRILDDPQLVDDVQIQNALLLTFQYTLIQDKETE
jgi:hypothetical protein